jgi:hypothetical protein
VRHLYSSIVRVERMQMTRVNGRPSTQWAPVTGLEAVLCRLNIGFVRPGDALPAYEAGKAQDRSGIMFCDVLPLKAGDRVVAISGPVDGTFEVRTIPDSAVGYAEAHHMEFQIWEVNQNLAGKFPFAPETT